MKCLTVRQPWATLLCDPTLPKWIETRQRRTHVRGTIGIITAKHQLSVSEWIRLEKDWHGSGECVEPWMDPTTGEVNELVWRDDSIDTAFERGAWTSFNTFAKPLPLGCLIGTVDLYDCVPINGCDGCPGDASPHVCIFGDRRDDMEALIYPGSVEDEYGEDISDQLPYGDFTPGRWAWLTRDAVLFDEPTPMRGCLWWQETP